MLFTHHLPFKIVPTLITAGRFNGRESSLVFVIPSGKLVIQRSEFQQDVADDYRDFHLCNVSSNICSLACGNFSPQDECDLLFYGSKTGVIAFDPEKNTELFYNEHRDGAYRIGIFSNLTSKDESILVVGGNCSLSGFNNLGAEVFWTVTGDMVSSMTSIDAELQNGEVARDLVVGSENFSLRIIHKDSVQDEITETDVVTNLTDLGQGYFGYGLRNGTIGVYNRATRVWRIKSKSKPVSMVSYDINQDGCLELICGWANGKVDARLRATGVVVFKTELDSPIAGLVIADYAGFNNILLVCAVDGTIQGYSHCLSQPGVDSSATEELLRQLTLRKQQLIMGIRNITEGDSSDITSLPEDEFCTIQVNTSLQVYLDHDVESQCVQLCVQSNNASTLRCLVLFGEGLFPGSESHIIYPSSGTNLPPGYAVQLRPPRNIPIDLFIKAYALPVKQSGQEQSLFHVLNASVLLPRYSMYRLIGDEAEAMTYPKPTGGVQFCLSDRPQRLIEWIQENFILNQDIRVNKAGNLITYFQSFRTFIDPLLPVGSGEEHPEPLSKLSEKPSQLICIKMTAKGEVNIQIDDIETASDMVQSIAKKFNLINLSSTCNFPLAFAQLLHVVQAAEGHRVTREQMLADMAEKIEQLKLSMVKAEDYRLTCNWRSAKETYTELLYANRQLLGEFHSRSNEHQLLTEYQRRINQLIEQASSLRVGKYKTRVVTLCREALQNECMETLFKVIRTGGEGF